MSMRTVHRRVGIVLPLFAWLLLALHVCADGADDHATVVPEQGHHGEGPASAGSEAESDCHSAAWVRHERGTAASRLSLEASGSPANASIWTGLDRAPMAGTQRAIPRPAESPPRLYLLHAALLI